MTTPPPELAAGLDRLAGELGGRRLAAHVEGFQEQYRAPGSARSDAARAGRRLSPEEAAAYAVYRMPATYAAVREVLAELAAADETFRPASLLDVGAGSGAATWAAAETFPELAAATLVDRDIEMTRVGADLAESSRRAAVRTATWRIADLGRNAADDPGADWPEVDLVIVSYALNELNESTVDQVVAALARSAPTVAVVEPGTPRGFAIIRSVRDRLIAAGRRIAAPCPHDAACPMSGDDWCHMSARLARSAALRRAKGGALGHEDEKFAYVVATSRPVDPARARVLRRPRLRSGHVGLRLCTRDDGLRDVTIARRQGAEYKAARRVGWGDRWPPDARREPDGPGDGTTEDI